MTSKEWKIIEGYENYKVSNYGNIFNNKTNKLLRTYINKKNYVYVNIKGNDNKYHNLQVHRLVAKHFISNPLNKPCVNHKDYNPSNNYFENLEWVTYSENCLYSKENISKSHKNKIKTQSHRLNISKSMINKKEHHIYKNGKSWLFRIRLNGNDINKTFKNKEEAITYRNNYLEEINYVTK